MNLSVETVFKDDGEIAVIEGVRLMEDEAMLAVVEAVARAKAENIRLKRERDGLKGRIAQEDERLTYA